MTMIALLIALGVIYLATANIVGFPNPATVRKSKTIDTYSAEAVAAGSFYGAVHEVPRGAYNIQFRLEGTLFDATTGDEDYQFFIQGSDDKNGNFVDLPGLAFTLREGVTSGDEVVPTRGQRARRHGPALRARQARHGRHHAHRHRHGQDDLREQRPGRRPRASGRLPGRLTPTTRQSSRRFVLQGRGASAPRPVFVGGSSP